MCFTIHLLLLMCFQQLTLALEELEAKKTKEDQRVKAKKIAIQNQLDEAQEKLAIGRNKEHELCSEVERCDKSIKDIDDVVARSQKDQYQVKFEKSFAMCSAVASLLTLYLTDA